MDSGSDLNIASAASDDTFCNHMAAMLIDLVSQTSNDIDSLNNAIHTAETLLADSPADLCIPTSVCKNLGALFERRFQQTQDLDDLQMAITWAEQGAAATPCSVDQVLSLSNLALYLVSRYEQTGELEDLREARNRLNEIPAPPNLPPSPNILKSHIRTTVQRFKMFYETSPLALLDSISVTISDLVSQDTGDPDYLDNAILLAETLLETAPPGHTIDASCFDDLSTMLDTRYSRTRNLDDLQKAITLGELAVSATPPNASSRADRLNNLSAMLGQRFERTGDLDDLQQAMVVVEEAIAAFHQDHPNRLSCMINLGNILSLKFERTGSLEDLQCGILRTEEAVGATPLGHPDRVGCLDNLSTMLRQKYERMGHLEDLQQAILVTEETVAATPLHHPDRVRRLSHLGIWFGKRFERTSDLNDLQQAMVLAQEVIDRTPLNHPERPGRLNNLSIALSQDFERTGDLDKLQRGIILVEKVVAGTPIGHPDRASRLNLLGRLLNSRFERTGDLDDLQHAILRTEEAVAGTSLDHPDRAGCLNNLGLWLNSRFKRTGDLDDLEHAIVRAEEAVISTPLNHPYRARRLNNKGILLSMRFFRTGDLDDLQQAILRTEESVAATPLDHYDRASRLNNLGLCLSLRFERTGDIEDLQQATFRAEEAIARTPLNHPDQVKNLTTLCKIQTSRFTNTQNLNDLQKAILRAEEAAAIAPLDHAGRAGLLHNLGHLLGMRSERTGQLEDLQQAILRAEEAVAGFPEDHPTRASSMQSLGGLLLFRYKQEGSPHDRERAVYYLRKCVTFHSAAPTLRIGAAMSVASIFEEDKKWADASEVSDLAVNLLSRVSSRSLGFKDQQHMIKKYAGLASYAAAAALQAGKSAVDAVQLLELGRGVIANLQFETRTDLTDLREHHPQLAKEFEQLRDLLDVSDRLSWTSIEPTAPGSSRHTTSGGLDKIINKIRRMSNFERFLLPPTANELMMAAAPMNPVVLINFSSIRCDAFLIQQHSITSLNLPSLHESVLNGLASIVQSRSPTKHQKLEQLKWWWDAMAGPVLEELGFREAVTTGESEWPRICWIPTGPLCLFPIHAAGYHCELSSRTVLDRVISSYSPSIKALLYARRNKAQMDPSPGRASNKTVLVSMGTTPGCSKLAFAEKETSELNSLLPAAISRVTLHEPHKEQVLAALDGCSVFHFAGHGLSHPSDPSMSSLLIADWETNPLTVKDLVTMRFHQNPPLLAYLSACSTGDNQEAKLLDEGIHLMGACQLAGFRNVIGTLWGVSDKYCVDAAKDVYGTMVKAGMSDESVSQGLHNAVLNLRGGPGGTGATRAARNARLIETEEENKENGIGDPSIWAAYIHIGI